MMVVREIAKRTQLISDINPKINRETALERDLFRTSSRRTFENLNDSVTDAMPQDIPSISAESCLFRIDKEQSLAFEFASPSNKRESRQKLRGVR